MVYAVATNRKTKNMKVFEFSSKAAAKAAIEKNWDKYTLIAIILGTSLKFSISYEDVEETITKKKPKVDIKD